MAGFIDALFSFSYPLRRRRRRLCRRSDQLHPIARSIDRPANA